MMISAFEQNVTFFFGQTQLIISNSHCHLVTSPSYTIIILSCVFTSMSDTFLNGNNTNRHREYQKIPWCEIYDGKGNRYKNLYLFVCKYFQIWQNTLTKKKVQLINHNICIKSGSYTSLKQWLDT